MRDEAFQAIDNQTLPSANTQKSKYTNTLKELKLFGWNSSAVFR